MLASNYPCYCHAAPGQFFTISLNQSGGLSLEWFANAVSRPLAELLADIEVSPSLAMFLPHIVGSGTPACDHLSRGSFLGLSLKTGGTEMFQAVADALAFEARLNLDTLEKLDIHVDELRAVGGGSRSEKLLELKATVLERPIRTLKNPEAALLGAAMLAEIAVGTFRDLESAVAECVAIERSIEPVSSALESYGAAYARFREIYGMLRPYYHHWRSECPATVLA
jgi:xylulokinase